MLQTIASVLFIGSLLLLVYVLVVGGVGVGRVQPPRPGDYKALDDDTVVDYMQITEKQHKSLRSKMHSVPFWTAIAGLVVSVILSIL